MIIWIISMCVLKNISKNKMKYLHTISKFLTCHLEDVPCQEVLLYRQQPQTNKASYYVHYVYYYARMNFFCVTFSCQLPSVFSEVHIFQAKIHTLPSPRAGAFRPCSYRRSAAKIRFIMFSSLFASKICY